MDHRYPGGSAFIPGVGGGGKGESIPRDGAKSMTAIKRVFFLYLYIKKTT